MLCLALLGFTENLYALVASILGQALDLCAVAACDLICGVNGLNEDLGGLQGLFLRFTVRGLENLQVAEFSSLFDNTTKKRTSSLRQFHNLRAFSLATAGP